jgi:hypothetical protein
LGPPEKIYHRVVTTIRAAMDTLRSRDIQLLYPNMGANFHIDSTVLQANLPITAYECYEPTSLEARLRAKPQGYVGAMIDAYVIVEDWQGFIELKDWNYWDKDNKTPGSRP